MKEVYPNVVPFAKGQGADGRVDVDQLCRAKVAEVLQAYLDAEADELICIASIHASYGL